MAIASQIINRIAGAAFSPHNPLNLFIRPAVRGAGNIAGTTTAFVLGGVLGPPARLVGRHPWLVGGTLALGTVGVGGVGFDTYKMLKATGRAAESEQMSRMIMTAQQGPYGPSGRMRGISSNHNNTAGLTLAAHYARNRKKSFGVLGLRFL